MIGKYQNKCKKLKSTWWAEISLSQFVWLLGAIIILFGQSVAADEGSELEDGSLEGKISSDLLRVLDSDQASIPVIVMLKQLPEFPAAFTQDMQYGDLERMTKARIIQSQMDLREWVNQTIQMPTLQSGDLPLKRYKFFWNVNAMMATVSRDLVAELAERDDIEKIILDRNIHLYSEPVEFVESDGAEYAYGLQKMGIPELRAKYPSLTGAGVNIGILDTGIDPNHVEFSGRKIIFRDFAGSQKDPYDDNGHGTHVAGTIGGSGIGGTHIGIAPEVSFTIGKIFGKSGSAELSGILRAMEWIANPDGNPDTPDRPRIVSNSWGGGPTKELKADPFFQAVQTWLDMEIFPSFAAGNSGPRASTVGSPGSLPNAFAVAATDDADLVATFSSRGPVQMLVDGKAKIFQKPDIAAPGVAVYSAMPGGKYAKMSGTSMATPHISGAIALLLQLHPAIKVAEIRDLLVKTALDLGSAGHDYSYGAGRAQLPQAVDKLESDLPDFGNALSDFGNDWDI